ncbi:MAG: class I SAM-dependent methyltransferase [Candidatus Brocadiia bacterium]
MAVQCPNCGRQYDVTLFQFGNTVACECGASVSFGEEEVQGARRGREAPGPVTAATWDYLTSRHIAEDYDRYFRYNQLFEFDTQVLSRWMPEPGRLLDLGCGTGRHLVHFAQRGFEVTGVDLSQHMLAVARRNLALAGCSATLVHGNVVGLESLGLGRFDYVICMFSTLGMIFGAENRLRFLRHVRQHLEPRGLFALHVHNRWHNLWYPDGRAYLLRALAARLRRRPEPYQKPVDGYRGIAGMSLYIYGAREIRKVLRRAGLRVEEMLYLNQARNGAITGLGRSVRANGFLIACRRPEEA